MCKKTLREVCDETKVSRRAVQGYEKLGLLKASDKNEMGHLLYDDIAIKTIKKIKFFQDIGFRLKEIKDIINAPNEILKDALIVKVKEMNKEKEKIEELIEIVKDMIKQL